MKLPIYLSAKKYLLGWFLVAIVSTPLMFVPLLGYCWVFDCKEYVF